MSFLPPGGADRRRPGSARRPDGAPIPDEAATDQPTTEDLDDPTVVLPRGSGAAGDTTSDDAGDADADFSAPLTGTDSSDDPDGPNDTDRLGDTDGAADGDGPDEFDDLLPGDSSRGRPRTRVERRRATQEPSHGVGRSIGLTALSAVPGLGLTLTRRRWIGIALLVAVVAGIAWFTWYLLQRDALSRTGAVNLALNWISQPNLLRLIWVGLIVGGLIWIGSVILTAVTARPQPMSGGQRTLLTGFTAVICTLIGIPVVMGMQYIDTTVETVDEVFAAPSNPDDPSSGGRPNTPDLQAANPWENVDRVTMLLIGSDSGDGREGVRPDSMIVVSIDTETGDSVMFGVPRNLQNAPIPAHIPLADAYPDGFNCGASCLINGVWTAAVEHSDIYPELYAGDDNPGLTATRETVAAVIGQPIDYTVLANLEGFADIVDAMGGVDINVQERLPMGGQIYDQDGGIYMIPGTESGWLEPGEQHLNGYETLWYARSRVTTDDFSRMRRQRCVVAAIVDQVDPATMLLRYRQILTAAGDNIRISLPADELPAWGTLVERVQTGSMRSLPLTPANVDVTNPDYNAIHLMVHEALIVEEVEPAPSPTASASPSPTADPVETSEPVEVIDEVQDPTETEDPASRDELAEIGAVC